MPNLEKMDKSRELNKQKSPTYGSPNKLPKTRN